jgi:hypothetical protein
MYNTATENGGSDGYCDAGMYMEYNYDDYWYDEQYCNYCHWSCSSCSYGPTEADCDWYSCNDGYYWIEYAGIMHTDWAWDYIQMLDEESGYDSSYMTLAYSDWWIGDYSYTLREAIDGYMTACVDSWSCPPFTYADYDHGECMLCPEGCEYCYMDYDYNAAQIEVWDEWSYSYYWDYPQTLQCSTCIKGYEQPWSYDDWGYYTYSPYCEKCADHCESCYDGWCHECEEGYDMSWDGYTCEEHDGPVDQTCLEDWWADECEHPGTCAVG